MYRESVHCGGKGWWCVGLTATRAPPFAACVVQHHIPYIEYYIYATKRKKYASPARINIYVEHVSVRRRHEWREAEECRTRAPGRARTFEQIESFVFVCRRAKTLKLFYVFVPRAAGKSARSYPVSALARLASPRLALCGWQWFGKCAHARP